MFDIAWSEMALIAAVALIVIGPKDLPQVLRTIGQWMRKIRLLAGEFQRNLDEMVRDAELTEVKREVERLNQIDVRREVETMVDPTGDLERKLQIDAPAIGPTPAEPAPAELPAADERPAAQRSPDDGQVPRP